jgi:hypothetical protein
MDLFQLLRLLEKEFSGHCEKFGRVGCAIFVQKSGMILLSRYPEPLVIFLQHAGPGNETGSVFKNTAAVAFACGTVNLVRKFVKYDVVAIVNISSIVLNVIPRKNNSTPSMRLAKQNLRALGHYTGSQILSPMSYKGVRVYEY